ncbi:hypothetical protein LENED_007037 [Lentinula edodes]|uniref:Uncharacterized protein n=1 Tax=Lentinula edodes TaxID=5353 RepID=A0A1Q3EDB9_LENED|nr:hypothetical protein LENED_007037 [Lentinula edodes]
MHTSSPVQAPDSDDLPIDDVPPLFLTASGPAQPFDSSDLIYDDWNIDQWSAPTPDLLVDDFGYSYSPEASGSASTASQDENHQINAIDTYMADYQYNNDTDSEALSVSSDEPTEEDYFHLPEPPNIQTYEDLLGSHDAPESDEELDDLTPSNSLESDPEILEDWFPYHNRKVRLSCMMWANVLFTDIMVIRKLF